LIASWAAPKNGTPGETSSAVAAAQDDSVFVEYAKTGRIEKFSSLGQSLTSWSATDGAAGTSPSIGGFTVGGEFVYALVGPPLQIRVWTLDGQHKLDSDLGEHLGVIIAPQIAVTPHDELLVFDPAAPRVYRFRIHF